MKLSVFLNTTICTAEPQRIGECARHVEQAGLDAVFTGDHLITRRPFLDSTVLLASAAAATSTIGLGFGVLLPALRPVAWAAKQIAALQHVSGNRVILGVGAGGAGHGTAGWRAAGVPFAERGARTDRALRLLPALIRGEPTTLDDGQVALDPGAPMPPVWIGGTGAAARRRVVQHAATWFPSMVTLDEVVTGAARLTEQCSANGVPRPAIAVGGLVRIDPHTTAADRAEFAGMVAANYGIAEDKATAIPMCGSPAEIAERFAAHTEQGVEHLVLNAVGADWRDQIDLIAQARGLCRA